MSAWLPFASAFAVFVLSHAVPARPPVRERLIRALGRSGYLAGYLAVSLAALTWLIAAAGDAPYVPLWPWAPWQPWIPNISMPVACGLAAYGTAAPNPLSFGGRHVARFDPDAPGIAGLTRHPLLWALALWAGAHAVPNGDLAHVLLFAGLAGFAGAGMPALDRRYRRQLGADTWRRLAKRTSLVPGAALVTGRWRPRGRPDPVRAVLAVLLWLALLALHPPVIGVSPLPP